MRKRGHEVFRESCSSSRCVATPTLLKWHGPPVTSSSTSMTKRVARTKLRGHESICWPPFHRVGPTPDVGRCASELVHHAGSLYVEGTGRLGRSGAVTTKSEASRDGQLNDARQAGRGKDGRETTDSGTSLASAPAHGSRRRVVGSGPGRGRRWERRRTWRSPTRRTGTRGICVAASEKRERRPAKEDEDGQLRRT